MVTKTILLIVISSLLLMPGQTALQPGPSHFPISPPPQAPLPQDEPPWYDKLVQTIQDAMDEAWQGISDWLEGAVDELERTIAEAFAQFLEGLVDEIIAQVTQMFENILNQTCGTSLLLPAGAVAGVWLISRRRNKGNHP